MKRSTRSALVVVPFLAFGLIGVGVTIADRAGGRSSKSPSDATHTTVPTRSDNTYPSYTTLAYDGATVNEPTRSTGQSKLWFNDGSWWGVLLDSPSGEFHIFWLEWATQTWHDTGTLVDERAYSRADVLWDGAKLHIASAGSSDRASHGARVLRFSYDTAARRYSIDPNFPTAVTTAGVEQLVMARESSGRTWVTFIRAGQAFVARSLDDESVWGDAVPLPSRPAASAATRVAIASYGTEIGVMWTSTGQDAVYFSTHVDGAPDDQWATTRTAIAGLAGAENDLSLQVFPDEKRVFAAVQTSAASAPKAHDSDAQVLLLDLQPDGKWRKYLFGRVRDHHAHPIIAIDREARSLYVLATAPSRGGAVYYKKTGLDDPSFPPGDGVAVIEREDAESRVDQATSAKQVLDRSTGLVTLASDDVTGRYRHGVLDLGGLRPGQPSPGDREPKPTGVAPVVNDLVSDDFNARPLGGSLGLGWSVLPPESTGTAQIAATPSEQDRSAHVTNGDGAGLRLCHALAPSTGDVTVAIDVRYDGTAGSDAVLTSVRGGAEAASVRFGSGGTFVYNQASERVNAETPFSLGVWYHSLVVVHPATKTFDWEIRERGSETPLLSVPGVAWRSSAPTELNQFCVSPPEGAGNGLLIDNLRISR